MVKQTNSTEITPYITKDGSEITELMHPAAQGNQNQSLARARVFPGQRTYLHKHHHSEEIYHVLAGSGLMTLGSREFIIQCGDTICIDPGSPHSLKNTENEDLVVLCSCAPAYSHSDTELL